MSNFTCRLSLFHFSLNDQTDRRVLKWVPKFLIGFLVLTGLSINGFAQAPSISYTSPQVYAVGNAITTLNPSNTGGASSSYSVWPSLPLGLTISATTGAITGTPTTRSKQIFYNNNFNSGSGGIATLYGNAAYVSGLVRLTDAVNNQNGALEVGASGTNSTSILVDFTLVTAKTSGGADGFSYSFSADGTPMDGTLLAEYGTGTALTVSFLTLDGSIRLYYGSGKSGSTVGSGNLLAINTSNASLWRGKSVPVIVSIDNDGKATVTVAGTIVLNAVPLPVAGQHSVILSPQLLP